MFKNVGTTIYAIGMALFWVLLIIALPMLLIIGIAGGTSLAITLFLAVVVSAFIIALPICGFGKLIMDVTAIRRKLED